MPLADSLLAEDDTAETPKLTPRAPALRGSKPRNWKVTPEALDHLDALANMAAPAKAATPEQTKPKESIGVLGTLKQGAKGTLRALGATVDTAQGDEAGVVNAAKEQAAVEKDPDLADFYAHIDERKKALTDPSLWEGIKAVGSAALKNPRGFGLMIAEQAPNSVASLGAGGVGALAGSFAGPVGTVVGGLAGLGLANVGLETGNKALEAGSDGSFGPAEQSQVRKEGLIKGATITGVDIPTLGMTKWITGTTRRAVERATTKTLSDAGIDVTSAAARKAALTDPVIKESVTKAQELAKQASNTLGKRLARTAGAVGLETVGEGAGEYLGEFAATGKPNTIEAVIEAFAGFGQSAGEIAITSALNRQGMKRLFDNPETAEKTAAAETKKTGIPYETIPHPTEPDKYVAVPKTRSASGIEFERDAEGNLTPISTPSTQEDFNLSNKPGFQHTAEDKIREQEQEKAREAAYAANPIIVPGSTTKAPVIAGKPVTDMSNNALIYTVNRGSARAQKIANDELARRDKQGIDPTSNSAPETPVDTVNRIIATGAERAKEDAKNTPVTPIPTPAPVKAATAPKTKPQPTPEPKKVAKPAVAPQKPVEVAKPKPVVQPTKPEVMKNAKAQPIEKIPERQGQGRLIPASKESILPQSPQAPTGEEKQVTVPPVIPNAEGTGGAAPTKTGPTPTTNTAKVLGEESVDLGPALRPHIDALIKRRAAARQIGKERTFDKALADAKAMLAGEKVSPARFKNAAKLFTNDKATADILTTLQAKAEEANKGTKTKPQPATSKSLDHGELNIKGRTDNINRELDRYKKEQADLAKTKAKATSQQTKEHKALAKSLLEQYGKEVIEKHKAKFGEKEIKNTLDQWSKWEPHKLISFIDKFLQEKAATKPAFIRSKAPAPQSQSRTRVESVINSVKAKWKNAPEVVVIDSITDAPADVQEENNRQLSMGASGEPEGFISGNKVYIVASQMKSPGDVVRVLLHESLGHFGLRGVFGTELQTVLRQVAAMRPRDMETKAQQYGLDLSNEEDRLTAAEEILAEMAQTNPQSGIVRRAIAAINKWLRNNITGFQNLQLSDSEIIQDILIPARRFVEKEQVTSSSFKKWFDNSKVVDANGNPLVVYHGTSADFSEFDSGKIGSRHPFSKEGFYATSSQEMASIYADSITNSATKFNPNSKFSKPVRNGANVMPLYVSLQNPLIVTTDSLSAEETLDRDNGQLVIDARKAGHDGVIVKRERGDEYDNVAVVAFKPEQVKSAIGNNGQFSATNPNILFSRSPAAIQSAIRERIDRISDSLIYNFQDRFKPLKDIQERTGPVAEDEDAALAEERYSGMVRARTDSFEEQLRDPLLKAIHDSGVAYDDVEKYLHALHAPSRNAAMREINPTEAELKSQTSALEKQRDSLAKDPDVTQYLKLRRELRDAEADIEDGIADESLAVAIKRDIAQLKKVQNVADYTESLEKLKALRLVKPFQGDNTALSGMSDAEAKAILAKIDANGTRKALERVSALVDDITSKTRQIYIDSGLEKANVIDAWNRKYEHYVPLHRDEVSGSTMPRIGQGFNIKGKESKRATGSTKDVTNILAHVVAQHEAAIIRSEKAKVDRALFAFAQRNPDPSLWTLDEAPMLRTVDPNSGLVVERVDPTYKNRPEVLTLKIDGEEHTITFNDKNEEAMRLVASMKNLGADQLGEVTQMVGKITRFLAMMNTTANPVFTARNFLRDLQTAYVNLSDTAVADKKAAVFRDVRSAIKGMWDLSRGKTSSQWAMYAQEFKSAGGQTGWMEHYKDIGERADKIKKELEAMKPGKMNLAMRTAREWGRVISDANNAVENGVRLSAYVQARKSGLSEAKAAQLAKNLTVNFNARGAQSVQLNSWYMFMNASIQGTARLVKAMGNKQVRKIVAGVILSGFLMDILARSMAGDDDDDGENDYDQLPEHVKAMNFVFMVNNRPVTIPMPYGYNFFASTGRKISEIMFRPHYSPVKSAADLTGVFLDAFSPTGQAGSFLQYISPTVTDPLVQWSENKNFAGNPLRRPQSPFGVPNPEYQMGFKSTSAPAKWLAEMMNNETGGNEVRPGFVNVNPAFFDFAVSSIAGGAGRTYLQFLSGPMKSAQGEDIKAKEVPFLNIFLGAKPEYQTEKKYFEAVRAVETAKNELKTYRAKGDTEMVKQILEDHGHEIRLQAAAKATKNSLARLKKRDLALDKTNPPNKRELRKQIEDQRREAMAKFNKQYRQAVEAH